MKAKHTPGPWKVSQCGKLIERDSILGTPIATLNPAGAIVAEESLANATVIASAPKLLAALITIVEQAGCYMDDGEATDEEMAAMAAARAIIAEAKGEA